jgi:hypothetical protein
MGKEEVKQTGTLMQSQERIQAIQNQAKRREVNLHENGLSTRAN